MTSRGKLLGSAVAFAMGCLVMITVHELGHVLAGVVQGNSPVLYGFSVEDGSTTDAQQVVAALAGPVLSLVSGLVLLALPIGDVPPFWRLTLVWLGLLSVQEFSGYLVTGPFAHIGDIGSVLDVTGAPAVVGWLGFVVGWGMTYLTGRHAVRRLSGFVSPEEPVGPQLRALGLFAWLAGAVLVVLLSAGLLTAGGVGADVVLFEAFGVLSSGIFLVFVRLFLDSVDVPAAGSTAELATPWAGVGALLVLAAGRQLLLAHGLAL